MLAIRLYDLDTGHVETLAEVDGVELARRWLEAFAAGGIGTSDVVYITELPPLLDESPGGSHRLTEPHRS